MFVELFWLIPRLTVQTINATAYQKTLKESYGFQSAQETRGVDQMSESLEPVKQIRRYDKWLSRLDDHEEN
jgi:hypothetical protein